MKKRMIYVSLFGLATVTAFIYPNPAKPNMLNVPVLISERKIVLYEAQRAINIDMAIIDRKQKEIEADIKEARDNYKDEPFKLIEKEKKYKLQIAELDSERKEIQFDIDNVGLVNKIEDKRDQIDMEKRKEDPDWSLIGKLTDERDTLQNEYGEKKLKVLYK